MVVLDHIIYVLVIWRYSDVCIISRADENNRRMLETPDLAVVLMACDKYSKDKYMHNIINR